MNSNSNGYLTNEESIIYTSNSNEFNQRLRNRNFQRQLRRSAGPNLSGENFAGANLIGENLRRAELSGANLEGAFLQGADLTEADLEGAHLERANLTGTKLRKADLSGAFLQGAILTEANLKDADLQGANLEGAILTRAILTGAILTRAILTGAILTGVDLSAVILSNIQRQQIAASARPSARPSAFTGPTNLTITTNAHGKVIRIPRVLRLGTKNSANKSCPSFKPLYDQLMPVNLDGKFRFHFEGETGRDATGLTKIVYDFLLPVYTEIYFIKAGEFIILKELENEKIDSLFEDTNQIIKLAKAGNSQIYLQIDPRLVQLLLQPNPVERIARNQKFNSLYTNLKKKIFELTSSGLNISNYLLQNYPNQSIKSVENINKLTREIQAEIILRKKLVDFGFTSWLQYETMARFINTFWNKNNSNKLSYLNRGVPVEIPLFSCELKYDFENFKKRLEIKRDDTEMIVDLDNIPQSLFTEYPAFRSLLEYIISDPSNRRKFLKYVAGTEYTLCKLLIILKNTEIPFKIASNGTKIYDLPFLAHTCFNTLDLFKSPRSGNYQEVWTVARINEEITKGIGFAAHN